MSLAIGSCHSEEVKSCCLVSPFEVLICARLSAGSWMTKNLTFVSPSSHDKDSVFIIYNDFRTLDDADIIVKVREGFKFPDRRSGPIRAVVGVVMGVTTNAQESNEEMFAEMSDMGVLSNECPAIYQKLKLQNCRSGIPSALLVRFDLADGCPVGDFPLRFVQEMLDEENDIYRSLQSTVTVVDRICTPIQLVHRSNCFYLLETARLRIEKLELLIREDTISTAQIQRAVDFISINIFDQHFNSEQLRAEKAHYTRKLQCLDPRCRKNETCASIDSKKIDRLPLKRKCGEREPSY